MDVAVRRRGGHMVDATIVPVSRQRNSRDENEQVKAGITPEDWKRRPSKNRQKDKDCALDEEAGAQLLRLGSKKNRLPAR
jgi:hypothetical protein